MNDLQTTSLDDALIAIQKELYAVNKAIGDRRFPAALAGLDQIIECASEAFDAVGKLDAPSS
jgi:hypothetical protein